MSVGVVNLVFNITVFITLLFYLLSSGIDVLNSVLEILPFPKKQKDNLITQVQLSIQGVFISTGKIYIGHCVFTWLWFSLFSVKYLYLYTLAAGVLAVLPIISPWMLVIPPAISLYCHSDGQGILALILFVGVYFCVINLIDGLLYENEVRASSFLFGLSVALGVYSFGVKGFLYGPLLVCLLQILYDVFRKTQ